MDIHRIVDVFTKQLEIAKFSRMVPLAEIDRNDFNLNIPRYIDSQQVITKLAEDLLEHYVGKDSIDRYDIYQHLLDYWAEVMQDDWDLLPSG